MQNWNDKIQGFLKKHRSQKRYAVVAFFMAVMVAVSVCGSLVMPAISMTGAKKTTSSAFDSSLQAVPMSASLTGDSNVEYFTEALSTVPSGAIDFSSYITSATVDPDLNTLTGDSRTGSFTLEYEGIQDISTTQPYIYYTLPSNVVIPKDYYGSTMTVIDSHDDWLNSDYNTNSTNVSGYYCIDEETGLLVIRFTEEYCRYLENASGVKGYIRFEGTVNRADTVSGDQTLNFGDQTITVGFDEKPVTLSKSGVASTASESNPTITWTVTLTNPGYTDSNGIFHGYTDLNGYTLEDVKLPSDVTVSPTGVGTAKDGTFTFNSTANQYETITFTYSRKLTDDELSSGVVTNTAYLKNDDTIKTTASSETKIATDKATIEKTGTPSYQLTGNDTNGDGIETGYILWTVTVERGYGESLNGYVITDEMLTGTAGTDYTIVSAVDKDGNDITSNVTISDGTAVINTDTSKVVITYKTLASDSNSLGTTYSNSATVTPPKSETPDDSVDKTVTYTSDLFDVTKTCTEVGEISATWTITLTTKNGNAGTLNGYVLTDEAFSRMIGSFTLPEGTTLTENDDGTYTVNTSASEVTITYTAKLTDAERANRTDGTSNPTISNDVTVTPPDDNIPPETKTTTHSVSALTNNVTKTLSGDSSETYSGYTNETTKSLSWTVTLDQYNGFHSGDQVFVDVLSATGNGDHYLIPSGANITLTAATSADGDYKSLTAGTDYTITYYSDENCTTECSGSEHAKSYKITFAEGVDSANYTHVKIAYTTVADVSEVDRGESSEFKNEAEFGGDSDTSTYTYTHEIPKTSISVQKNWVDDDESQRPTSITVQLYRKEKDADDDTWEAYGDPVTLRSSESWSYTWSDLLAKTEDTNQNTYVYKVEETKIGDDNVEDDSANNYTVTYGDGNSSGVESGTLSITNTWDLIQLTVNKSWVGDTTSDTRPDSISVRLQSKTEDGDWEFVENQETKSMTKEGNWSSVSWTSLPKTDSSENTLYYRAVEVDASENIITSETDDGYIPTYDDTGITTTGTSTITNTYNQIDLTVEKSWVGDEGYESNRPESVEIKLQYREKDSSDEWKDITNANLELTKQSDNSFTTGSWIGLPKTNSSGTELEYRAVEVTDLENYTSTESDAYSTSGTATVTNTYNYITITGKKEWSGDTESDHSSLKVVLQLQRRTGESVEWENMDGDSYTVTVTSSDSWTTSWAELPKTDGNGNLYYYRVTETKVLESDGTTENTDYNVSDFDSTGSNESTTFTITNTKKPPVEKSAIKVIKDVPVSTVSKSGNTLTDASGNTYNIEKVSTITKKDLEDWPTTTVTIDGTATECYVFQWWLDVETGYQYTFTDQLPDNCYFLQGYATNDNQKVGVWHHLTWGSAYFTNSSDVSYDETTRTMIVNESFTACDAISYFTAVPKSIVDAALEAENGSYALTNTLKLSDGTEETSTLTITQNTTEDADVLEKTYLGYSESSKVMYTLVVNPDGEDLSAEDTLDITDILTLSNYTDSNGTVYSDYTDLVDAILGSVLVQKINDDGTYTTINDYSYRLEEVPVTKTTDLNDALKSSNAFSSSTPWDGVYNKQVKAYTVTNYDSNWNTWFKKGMVVTLELEGTPGEAVNARAGEYNGTNANKYVTLTSDEKYDENRKATVTLTFDGKFDGWTSEDSYTVYVGTDASSSDGDLISRSATVSTTSTQYQLLLEGLPDETPLRIRYTYVLKANAATAAVDSEATAGSTLPDGSKVTLSNSASMKISSGTATDSENNKQLEVNYSTGGSSSISYPSLQKVNIGNYAINSLSATFYFAKWDETNETWLYATEFTEGENSNGTKTGAYVITWGSAEEVTTDDGTTTYSVPTDAAKLDVNGTYSFQSLDTGTVYKLVEITAPSETGDRTYQQTGWDSTTQALTNMGDFTFYFFYGSGTKPTVKELGTAVDSSKIQTMSTNTTYQVPNVELIDVTATKAWAGTEPEDATSVEFTLYYASSKSAAESTWTEATAEALGLSSLESTKTLLLGDGQSWSDLTATWSVLPNGVDGSPIYYFVKETAYTIGGKTYKLQSDGTYVYTATADDGTTTTETGEYTPIYTGNGVNSTGSVTVTNSQGLEIVKVWKKSDGTVMTSGIPATGIKYKVQGKKSGSSEWVDLTDELELTETDSWKHTLASSDLLSGITLTDYVSFQVVETQVLLSNETDYRSDLDVALYYWTKSSTSATDGTSGVLTMTNKSKKPTSVDVTVNKTWGSGTTKTDVEMTLLQSTSSKTLDEVKALDLNDLPGGIVKYTADEVTNPVTLTTSENSWTYTWNDLPYESNDGTRYYYYVVESSTLPVGYSTEYAQTDNGDSKTVTVTNSKVGSLVINKLWKGSSGETIAGSSSDLPSSITLEIYRKANATSTSTEDVSTLASKTYYAFGDSITNGYGASVKYSDLMATALGVSSVGNSSSVGYQIQYIKDLISNVSSSSYNVAFVIAGTNDLIMTDHSMDTMKDDMKALIETFDKDKVVFIGSVPKFTGDAQAARGTTYGSVYNPYNGKDDAYYAAWDALVREYNSMLQTLVNEEKEAGWDVHFVDTYTAVGDNMLSDGTHPNDTGQQKIADAFVAAVKSYYGITSSEAPAQGVNTFPSTLTSDDYVKDVTITPDDDGNWSLTLSDLDMQDSSGNDYIYYVKEKSGNYSAAYTNNGVIISTATGTITVTNTLKTISLGLNKTWSDSATNTHTGSSVAVKLYRSTKIADVPKNVTLITTPDPITAELTVIAGKTGTYSLASDTFPASLTVADTLIATYTLSSDSKTITVTGVAAGNTTITGTTTGGASFTLNVTVSPALTLSASATSLTVGGTATLSTNKSSDTITYSSSDVTIASVNANGTVTAYAAGTVTITATDSTTNETATVTITVTEAAVEELTVTPTTVSLTVGGTQTLTANKTVTSYTSSNTSVATVSSDGVITAVAAGTATITATDSDGMTATVSVTVTEAAVEELTVTPNTVSLTVGGTQTLTANKTVTSYTSSNTSIATVSSDGVITAVAAGTATITATDSDGKTATVSVTVTGGSSSSETSAELSVLGSRYAYKVNANNAKYENGQIVITLSAADRAAILEKGGNVELYFDSEFLGTNKISNATVSGGSISGENIENQYLWFYSKEITNYLTAEENKFGFWFRGSGGAITITITLSNTSTASVASLFSEDEVAESASGLLVASNEAQLYGVSVASDTGDTTGGDANAVSDTEDDTSGDASSTSSTELYDTYTLTYTDGNFSETISNLPACDASGNPYYYWAVEDTVAGYTPSYQFIDGDSDTTYCINAGTTSSEGYTVNICNTKNEDSSTEMPSTGGTGTWRYTATGAALMSISAATICVRRRRNGRKNWHKANSRGKRV